MAWYGKWINIYKIAEQMDKGMAINVPFACIGDCSEFKNCNQACIDKGYPIGGFCLGSSILQLTCCCTKHR